MGLKLRALATRLPHVGHSVHFKYFGVVLDGASWWAWNNTSLQARVSKKSLGIRGFRLFDANLDTVDDVVNPDDPELAWLVNKKFIRMPSVLIYLAFVYQNEMIMLGQSYTSLQVSSQE
jgi:hypothetical protein